MKLRSSLSLLLLGSLFSGVYSSAALAAFAEPQVGSLNCSYRMGKDNRVDPVTKQRLPVPPPERTASPTSNFNGREFDLNVEVSGGLAIVTTGDVSDKVTFLDCGGQLDQTLHFDSPKRLVGFKVVTEGLVVSGASAVTKFKFSGHVRLPNGRTNTFDKDKTLRGANGEVNLDSSDEFFPEGNTVCGNDLIVRFNQVAASAERSENVSDAARMAWKKIVLVFEDVNPFADSRCDR